MTVPARQIRAVLTDETIRVYQAYPPEIDGPALAAGRFVPPFKRARMTLIKPSFLWMRTAAAGPRNPGRRSCSAST